MNAPTPPPPSETAPPKPVEPSAQPLRKNDAWRKIAGQIISLVVLFGAVVLVLWVWSITERHPRTDDAVARADVVEIVPQVSGHIIKLNVQDNEEVKDGDVLIEIDPNDYKLTLDKAKSDLATLDMQIEVARSENTQLKFKIKAAEAGVDEAKAQLKQAADTLQRMKPLLPKGFATADDVDKAETEEKVAAATLADQEQSLNQARTTISKLETMLAQRPGAVAAVNLAALQLARCKVLAPFPGRVINLNIAAGAYASEGIPVFALLDTTRWYVIANFREGEIPHFAAGAPVDVYLMSKPSRHFKGTVQGIGWAVTPTDQIDIPHSLPYIQRELNWVHIAQRFPVRIEIEDPDPNLFRMGASAVAIIK
jgi:membrane fusion protein, multidrug efflux system